MTTLARPLALPRIRKFGSLFRMSHYGKAPEGAIPWRLRFNPDPKVTDSQNITDHISFEGFGCNYRYGRAVPSARVVNALRRGTIDCGRNDTLSFQVIDHHNGKALVVANHSQIIGSVWLAYIDADSVPKGDWHRNT